ncbi:MAG: Na+/H+ antiporter NhaA [Bacteroidales bacterium]|nr:Na+/H+ antiporter NhaA [Bacteroidales bacterium]
MKNQNTTNNSNSKSSVDLLVEPFQRFFNTEASGGIILLIFTIFALIWANSRWSDYYFHFWENHLTLGIGSFELSKTLHHWINDGLMAIFFFVVGLEIKRELIVGELSSFKKGILPITAALGGMLLPALLYVFLNKNPETAGGWGIPMATDIAFSLGILSLLGKRVPISLKVFLVALAIVDDLGAILVIALFYSADIHLSYLLIGLGLFLILVLFNILKLRNVHIYMAIGWIIWYMFLKSGIHPTIAGVLIAFTIPLKRKINVSTFRHQMEDNLEEFCEDGCPDETTLTHEQLAAIDNIEDKLDHVKSPAQYLEHSLHNFVTYIVMPIFALANAGVMFNIAGFSSLFNSLSGTIEVSLIVGKVSGIFLFTWVSVKLGLAVLPVKVRWVHILGLGFIGGMGFTMSIFITNLAFKGGDLLNPAKIGILIGSLVAGIIGYLLLRATLKDVRKVK